MKKITNLLLISASILIAGSALVQAQGPSIEQALSFKPSQIGSVDYAQPAEADAAQCRLEQLSGKIFGWKLLDKNGQTLRMFVDTNNDKSIDQWRYFKDGVEVYRDIDTDNNNKIDECRWFNMGGSRWGLDKNEDQRIESWKQLSAEECAFEVFNAVKSGDKSRFQAVLISQDEIDNLDLTDAQKKQLSDLLGKAGEKFDAQVQSKKIDAKAEFLQFNGDKPSAIPSDSGEGITVFENVSSFARLDEKEFQISNGTFVQVGTVWKALFCPVVQSGGEQAIASIFQPGGAASTTNTSSASADKQQEWISAIEKLDTQLSQTTDKALRINLHKQRAGIVEKMAQNATGEDRNVWYRQLADGLSMGAQMGELPEGTAILSKFALKFKDENDVNLAAYFTFRELMANYYLGMSAPNANWAEIQVNWFKGLEQFIADYPTSPDCAEALFQLASAREISGNEADAMKYYQQIVSNFPDTPQAPKSKGALFRLDCIGKTMNLVGVTSNNKQLDLSKFKSYNVLVYYWRTDSSTADSDLAALKKIKAKYGKDIQIIGVNLDNNNDELLRYMEANNMDSKFSWQINGKGPDGPLANAMGIINLPTIILVDKDGKIVNRNAQTKELESAVKLLVSPPKIR